MFFIIMTQFDSIIADTLQNYTADANEVEYRLGYYQGKSFNPNIGVFEFQKLLTNTKTRYSNMTSDTMLTIISVVDDVAHIARIHDDGTGNKVRAICLTDRVDPKIKNVEFYSKAKTDYSFNYNLRVSYGRETPLTEPEIATLIDRIYDGRTNKGAGTIKTYRYAKRYSFVLAEFDGHPVTLTFTVVKQGQGITFRGSQVLDPVSNPEEQYEVELEFLDWSKELFETHKDYAKKQLSRLLLEFTDGPTCLNNTIMLDNVKQFVALCNGYFGMKVSPDSITDVSPNTLSTISKYFIGALARSLTYGLIEQKKLLRTDPKKSAPYCVTDKADGQRALLFVNRDGQSFLVMSNIGDFYTKLQVNKTGLAPGKIGEKRSWLKFIPTAIDTLTLKNSLYDGEVVVNTNGDDMTYFFLAFDCLISNNIKLTALPFWDDVKDNDRKRHLDDIIREFPTSNLVSPNFVNVRSKQFYHYVLDDDNVFTTEFLVNIDVDRDANVNIVKMRYASADKTIKYDLDGIIFQKCDSVYPDPVDGPSRWPDTYKWKPVKHTTIDFKMLPDAQKIVVGALIGSDGTYAVFKAGYNYQRQYRDSLQYNPYKCYAKIIDEFPRTVDTNEAIVSGDIVECRFVYGTTSHWEPVRVRRDKLYPNGQAAHDDNMNFISNPITFDSLKVPGGSQSSSVALKSVNKSNRAYSNAHIAKYGDEIRAMHLTAFHLLDLACGKGQSADGWYNAGATNIVGIDTRADIHMAIYPADKYLKQLPNAPKTDYYQASMIVPLNLSTVTSDALARQLENPQQFAMSVCNFAIHYAFASKTDLRNLLYNITRNLKRDGYFVGSYMNGKKVLDLINNKTTDVTSQIRMTYTNNSVSAVTVAKKQVLWKLTVPDTPAESSIAFGRHLEVMIDSLYGQKPSNEYLVDLDNPEILSLFTEYGLKLVEHVSFDAIDIKNYKQMFINKITKEKLTVDESYWQSLHHVFAFQKTNDVDHMALLQKSWNVETSTIAPIAPIAPITPSTKTEAKAKAVSGIVPGKKKSDSFKAMSREQPEKVKIVPKISQLVQGAQVTQAVKQKPTIKVTLPPLPPSSKKG